MPHLKIPSIEDHVTLNPINIREYYLITRTKYVAAQKLHKQNDVP